MINKKCKKCNGIFLASHATINFCCINPRGKIRKSKCKVCKKCLVTYVSNLNSGRGKFCSFKCRGKYYSGNRSKFWTGGIRIDSNGYRFIFLPQNPMAEKSGYVAEHRLIMSKKIGRNLSKNESVHHINAVKYDNRPENLELVVTNPHFGRIHCPNCSFGFLIQ